MPVDINKWKETSLDADLEVSLVKELGEGAELSAAGSASSSGTRWCRGTDGPSQLHGGLLGHAKGWTRRISTHRSHWYSQLPTALHLSLLLGARGGNFRLGC